MMVFSAGVAVGALAVILGILIAVSISEWRESKGTGYYEQKVRDIRDVLDS